MVVKLVQARIALYEGTFRRYHPELNLQGYCAAFLTVAANAANEIISSGQFSLAGDYASLFNSADLSGIQKFYWPGYMIMIWDWEQAYIIFLIMKCRLQKILYKPT